MEEAWLTFTLWDCTARTVDAMHRRALAQTVHSTTFGLSVKLEKAPRVGAHLTVPGWDCGRVESVNWDSTHRRFVLAMPDIFVDDGPQEQRETDYAVLANAVIVAGWDVVEERTDAAVMSAAIAANQEAAQRRQARAARR